MVTCLKDEQLPVNCSNERIAPNLELQNCNSLKSQGVGSAHSWERQLGPAGSKATSWERLLGPAGSKATSWERLLGPVGSTATSGKDC